MASLFEIMDGRISMESTQNLIRANSEVELLDGASVTFNLKEGVMGCVVASTSASEVAFGNWVLFIGSENNTVVHMAASANTATSDLAGNFCVYCAGGDLVFKNNRGTTRYVSYWLFDV